MRGSDVTGRSQKHRRLGLYPGTFNPIHLGHLLIAEAARDQFQLEKVIFVTSPRPPHRTEGLLPSEDRHDIVKAATVSNPHFEASTIELERDGPSYTIDTVKEVRGNGTPDGGIEVSLIIGGDNLPFLKSWHKYEELLSICRLLVAPRLRYVTPEQSSVTLVQPETDFSDVGVKADIHPIDFPGIAISSSTIRKRLKEGKSVLYMVPREVNELLLRNSYFVRT